MGRMKYPPSEPDDAARARVDFRVDAAHHGRRTTKPMSIRKCCASKQARTSLQRFCVVLFYARTESRCRCFASKQASNARVFCFWFLHKASCVNYEAIIRPPRIVEGGQRLFKVDTMESSHLRGKLFVIFSAMRVKISLARVFCFWCLTWVRLLRKASCVREE